MNSSEKIASMKKCRVQSTQTTGLAFFVLLILLGLTGCMQLETRIRYHPDGSATITERVRFSRELLELDKHLPADQRQYEKLLSEAGARGRMPFMGKGIELKSHQETKNVDLGARESITVYHIPRLEDLRYTSPFLAYKNYEESSTIRFEVSPYAGDQHGRGRGKIRVGVKPAKPAVAYDKKVAPKVPSPLAQQEYRDLAPVLRDLLRGFEVRLTFESYAHLGGFATRGYGTKVRDMDILNFTDKNLDQWGGVFVENEEIMLDLARLDFHSSDIVQHVRNFSGNKMLPLFLPWGSRHMWYTKGPYIYFPPSRPLFDRMFQNFQLTLGHGKGKELATFEKYGWKGNEEAGQTKGDPPTKKRK